MMEMTLLMSGIGEMSWTWFLISVFHMTEESWQPLLCRYIKWIEQTYPQGGKESSLTLLLERAVMKFTEEKKYHNDTRYVDLWIKFVSAFLFFLLGLIRSLWSNNLVCRCFELQAEDCSDPLDVYRYMQAQGIGTMQASFYIAWSEEYEKIGNSRMADSIFQEGLKCGAEPLDRLQQFHKYGVLYLCFCYIDWFMLLNLIHGALRASHI